MTNTELKALIDAQITDVVATGGVSNVNEGGRMKDMIDYTDQEVGVNAGSIIVNAFDITGNTANIALCTKDADTDVSANGWVLDEDNMASDSNTKVPTQQSVKAYVDASANIYSEDGALAGNRVVDTNGNSLNLGTDNISEDSVTLRIEDGFTSWHRKNASNQYKQISIGFNSMIVKDQIDEKGLTYSADYSANFVDRSIVDKAYVDALISSPALEWNAQVFQSGTNDPLPQSAQIDTITVGSFFGTPATFRDIDFARTGIGTYTVRIRYTLATVPTSTSKLSLIFGDAVCRVTQTSTGSVGGGTPYNYKEWVFETRTPAGVIEDDLLLGNNGGYVNIKLYP